MTSLRFPESFLWGTATAAFQVEGAASVDGRSPSIWDEYLRREGNRGDNGDVAADHYVRWSDDLDLLKELGAPAYRFSVSWSRVLPDDGTVNQTGLDFYRRLIEGLQQRGIRPALQMYHMDLPDRFRAQGGWASRDTALRFGDYANLLTKEFAGSVDMFMTVNELYYESWLGYAEGAFPPGTRDSDRAVAALHHMLLAHGLGVSAVRANAPSAQVGIVTGYAPALPASSHPADVEAARLTHIHSNRAVLDPILRGGYPVEYAEHPARAEALHRVTHGEDPSIIGQPVDFVGLNYYFKRYIAAFDRLGDPELALTMDPPSEWLQLRHLREINAVELRPRSDSRTMAGWAPQPEGLAQTLTDVTAEYGRLPLYVTENGLPLPDYPGPDGAVNDIERIAFMTDHLRAVHEAIEAGADVRGYFAWSFMDNLEWTSGYGYRFGLTYIDFPTQKRIPKASFSWYSDLVASNRLSTASDPAHS